MSQEKVVIYAIVEINLTGGTDRTRKLKILTEIFGLKRNFGQEKY
jgi:hypothetical protein